MPRNVQRRRCDTWLMAVTNDKMRMTRRYEERRDRFVSGGGVGRNLCGGVLLAGLCGLGLRALWDLRLARELRDALRRADARWNRRRGWRSAISGRSGRRRLGRRRPFFLCP